MAILGCTRCGAKVPSRETNWRDQKSRAIAYWWDWPGSDENEDLLMVCPDCILQLLHDDMERSVSSE